MKAPQSEASIPPTDAPSDTAGADDGATASEPLASEPPSADSQRFAKLRRGLLIALLVLVAWSIVAALVGVARGLSADPVDPLNPTSPISGSSTDG